MASGTHVIEDAITLDGLRVFKQEADQHYAGTSVATTTENGLMSASDKARLDGMVTTLTEAEVKAALDAAFTS